MFWSGFGGVKGQCTIANTSSDTSTEKNPAMATPRAEESVVLAAVALVP